MYAKVETDASMKYLHLLAGTLQSDYCLIGGWAVFYLVNGEYSKQRKRDYLGSRDIDIGLPDIDSFEMAEKCIRSMGFEQVSFRFLKQLDYETGRALSPEEAKRVPSHNLIYLYIDAALPEAGKDVKTRLGFLPPDEPVLAEVFRDRTKMRTVMLENKKIFIPNPAHILAMKLNAVGNRTQDHKKIKDICDIAALCLFSGRDPAALIAEGKSISNANAIRKIKRSVNTDDIRTAGLVTDIPLSAMKGLFSLITG
jgi:hypothetical protein